MKGFVKVRKLVPIGVEDALAYVIDWYAKRGWTVLEEGATYQAQGKLVLVSAWASPPKEIVDAR